MRDAIAIGLMAAGVAVQLLCCLGAAVMRDAVARVHFTAPAFVAALLIAAALLVREGLTQLSGRGLLVAALLAFGGPIQAHATARAIRIRRGESP